MKLNRFEKWILEKIAKKAVIQGPDHEDNITNMYGIIALAARIEFNEDNKPTFDSFLRDCHQESLNRVQYKKTGEYRFVEA